MGYHCTSTRMPTSNKADTVVMKMWEKLNYVAGEDANGAAAMENLAVS